MNVGDFVRNKYGIAKVIDIIKEEGYYDILVFDNDIVFMVDKDGNERDDVPLINKLPLNEHIDLKKIKSSPNIIDLIEVGDYVNGLYVYEKAPDDKRKKQIIWVDDSSYSDSAECPLQNEDIETIVTKEQFETMKYEL